MNIADDDFTLFGLAPRFALDGTALDGCWRALQAKVHPDRFASDGAAAQRLAMQWAVRVNQGYQRLKDPLKRGAYLCELRGAPIKAENNTAMPVAFLMQQMAWREALDEADGAAAQRLAMQWSVRINEAYRRLREPLTRGAYLCELRGAPIAAHSNTAMPGDFLMQQMAWREALAEADGDAALAALDAEVRAAERDLLAQVATLLDDEPVPALAAERVRALMFITRFRADLTERLDAVHDSNP